MIKQIESGTYELDPPKWDAITSDSKDFIRQCLTVEVGDRPTSIDLMSHAIFKNDSLPSEDLGTSNDLLKFKARLATYKMMSSVKAIVRLSSNPMMLLRRAPSDPNDARHKEASDLFLTIDSDGDGQLELYEIILYMQEYCLHLFYHPEPGVDGLMIVDDEKLRAFATLLRDQLDRDKDGFVSREEFIKGYCIWQMHLKRAKDATSMHLLASDVYSEARGSPTLT